MIDTVRDKEDPEHFKAVRLNCVCLLPKDVNDHVEDLFKNNSLIDNTFEIQIRTVFSEGWHEIEHDMRYKRKDDWIDATTEARAFNGILATLSTCDWSIISLFDQLAYRNYKEHKWEAMFRSKYRLRTTYEPLDENVVRALDENIDLAKQLFRVNRQELIEHISKTNGIPKRITNVVLMANFYFVKNEKLNALTPDTLKKLLVKTIDD